MTWSLCQPSVFRMNWLLGHANCALVTYRSVEMTTQLYDMILTQIISNLSKAEMENAVNMTHRVTKARFVGNAPIWNNPLGEFMGLSKEKRSLFIFYNSISIVTASVSRGW